MTAYSPKTGARCSCRRGVARDNCPTCEGTGWVIDFRKIHEARAAREAGERCSCAKPMPSESGFLCVYCGRRLP